MCNILPFKTTNPIPRVSKLVSNRLETHFQMRGLYTEIESILYNNSTHMVKEMNFGYFCVVSDNKIIKLSNIESFHQIQDSSIIFK